MAKAAILAASFIMVAIRAPYGRRSAAIQVVHSEKNTREITLLSCAWVGFLLPLLWLASPALSFADYSLRPAAQVVGVIFLAAGLALFWRSHADLGANFSLTLEVRENHRLITHGAYRTVRHPMYTALFAYSIGQILVIPNWVAGPSNLVAFGILFAFRFRREERMMLETFGDAYVKYAKSTKRLIPGVW